MYYYFVKVCFLSKVIEKHRAHRGFLKLIIFYISYVSFVFQFYIICGLPRYVFCGSINQKQYLFQKDTYFKLLSLGAAKEVLEQS